MKRTLAFVLVSLLLLLAACAQKAQPKAPAAQPPAAMPPAAAQAPDAAVSNIETTSAQVDQIDKNLDTSEIDKLDQDLAAIDNLDLG